MQWRIWKDTSNILSNWFLLCDILGKETIGTKTISMARNGCGGKRWLQRSSRGKFWDDGIILYGIVVIDMWFNVFVKPTELYTSKSKFSCIQIYFEKNQPDWQRSSDTQQEMQTSVNISKYMTHMWHNHNETFGKYKSYFNKLIKCYFD